jgi:hypothetical protein
VKEKKNVILNDDGSYVVKESGHKNIPAFIICLLLALVIWVYTANEPQADAKNNVTDEPTTEEVTCQSV